MSDNRKDMSRRRMLTVTAGLGGLAMAGSIGLITGQTKRPSSRTVTLDAKPQAMEIDLSKTAVIVVDMQNDFGSKGGMFERAGIDISMIHAAVAPTSKVLTAARKENLKIIYLKMGF